MQQTARFYRKGGGLYIVDGKIEGAVEFSALSFHFICSSLSLSSVYNLLWFPTLCILLGFIYRSLNLSWTAIHSHDSLINWTRVMPLWWYSENYFCTHVYFCILILFWFVESNIWIFMHSFKILIEYSWIFILLKFLQIPIEYHV